MERQKKPSLPQEAQSYLASALGLTISVALVMQQTSPLSFHQNALPKSEGPGLQKFVSK